MSCHRGFFHSWQRKIGCLLLLLALPFMGAWLRSLVLYDLIVFPLFGRQHQIVSVDGQILWFHWSLADDGGQWVFSTFESDIEMYFSYLNHDVGRSELWTASYWMIVLPVTALSAVFLFTKSRPTACASPKNNGTFGAHFYVDVS